jgi:NAD(P)-dependent dehydrogenase (short-subunit alcohol dehydrogenase family)
MADAHSKPVWFITGCSTGFGRELSVILLKRGYCVVVTARDKAKVEDIVAGHDKDWLALALDVDKQKQIDAAVKAAEARFGRIDVLVNNAGYGYLAAIEEGDDADVRAIFDTNFFGLAAMTLRCCRSCAPKSRVRSSTSRRSAASSVSPGRAITPRPSSRSKVCRRRCRKKSRPLGIKVRHCRARPLPHRLGRPLFEDAKEARRRLHGDGHRPPPTNPGRQRLASRRSRSRVRSDHHRG